MFFCLIIKGEERESIYNGGEARKEFWSFLIEWKKTIAMSFRIRKGFVLL